MIIAGDIAIANNDEFLFSGFPKSILAQPWIINLEGAISNYKIDNGLYNNSDIFTHLNKFNLGPIFIGNNHITDIKFGIKSTVEKIENKNYKYFGAGINVKEARKAALCSDVNEYCLLGFGWSVIGCKPVRNNKEGVNPFYTKHVIKSVNNCIKNFPDHRVVIVIHGNYEFEKYPQPAHRQLSKELIDLGVYSVIFHHPHIVGPVEQYKGHTIAYSLGNWAFSYKNFFNNKLTFPSTSFHQIALELGFQEDFVHSVSFIPPNTIKYGNVEKVGSADFSLRPEFEGLSNKEYVKWFKINRIKRKYLPIYKSPHSVFINYFYDNLVKIRQLLIDCATKLGLKSYKRKG